MLALVLELAEAGVEPGGEVGLGNDHAQLALQAFIEGFGDLHM